MKKSNAKRKLISNSQIITYVLWFVLLLLITIFIFYKRNSYFNEAESKFQSIVSNYGYAKSKWTRMSHLEYEWGSDASITINLEYDINGYILENCSFSYKNYDNSSFEMDTYYDVIDSILPELNIYSYKEKIEDAINNKLYIESGRYTIDFLTEHGENVTISIRDNTYKYFDYNYEINLDYSGE